MLREDGLEGTGSTRGIDVTNDSDNDDGRGFDDGNSLDDFLLVNLGSRLVDLKNENMNKNRRVRNYVNKDKRK